jgi:predicted TIM-barrel fold metal-dependent hydrolase
MVEYFVQRIGAARIVYGSDAPWCSMASQLGRVVFARIDEWEKRAILGINAQRIAEGTWLTSADGGP